MQVDLVAETADEMLITAKSPAFTLEFALKIVEALKGINKTNEAQNKLENIEEQTNKRVSKLRKRGATIGTLSQFLPTPTNIKPDAEELGPLFSRQFFMEKMLGLSTEEMLLNKAMLDREIEEMKKKADAAKEEGGDEESEGGDDLGF